MTNALRLELAPKNVRVSALCVAYMDTDMLGGFDVSKLDPRTSRHSPSTASPAAAPHQPAESSRNRGIPPGPVFLAPEAGCWRERGLAEVGRRRPAAPQAGWLPGPPATQEKNVTCCPCRRGGGLGAPAPAPRPPRPPAPAPPPHAA